MTRLLLTGILSCAITLSACATSQFDRHFAEGRYEELGRLFESDSALQRDEHALFRAGVAHALPTSPIYRPEVASEIFDRLLTLHPKTSYRGEAELLGALLDELLRLQMTADQRAAEIERLTREEAEARERIAWLRSLLEKQEVQTNLFRGLAERLEEELRETRSRHKSLQEELERLKEIDLRDRRGTNTEQTTPES